MEQNNRTLTDADVQAIVELLKAELVADFYGEVGRGVWSWVKKAFWALILLLAIYGMTQSRDFAIPVHWDGRGQ